MEYEVVNGITILHNGMRYNAHGTKGIGMHDAINNGARV